MARRRRVARRMGSHDAAMLDVDLMIGSASKICSVERLEAAWELRREALMATRRPGRRPGAYWLFDLHEEIPVGVTEVERLIDLDEMDVEEMDAVVAEAARQVEQAGLSWAVHGQHPSIARGNVVQRLRGIPEWGLR